MSKEYKDWTLEDIINYEENIPYHLLAHGYLLLNIKVYEELNKKLKAKMFQQKLNEILEDLKKIQRLQPEEVKDKNMRREGKESVWNNKNIVMNSINTFFTIKQSKEFKKEFLISTLITIISLITAIVAIIF